LTVFAHALFGANDLSATVKSASVKGFAIPGLTASDTAFAAAFGGGADSKIAKNLAFRIQADYLLTTHNFSGGVQGVAAHQNNVRASVGIVYSFGAGNARAEPSQSPRATAVGMKIPSLGITVTLGANSGAEITDEAPNGIAALAGVHVGDVINAVDGKRVSTPMELAAELTKRPDGDKVKIGFLIRGQWQTDKVLLLGNH
jgi:S1-C subfamily serine protease